jgi:mycothiol synthase
MQIFALDPGWIGAAFHDGRLVGFVLPDLKVTVVTPDHRRQGVGRRLIELGLDIAATHARSELFMGCLRDEPGGAAFLRATGFLFHSTVWDLELPADRDVPKPVWPGDVRARPFDRDRDVAALPTLANVAFADHPTPIVMEEEMIRASIDDPNTVDDDAILIEDRSSRELVGFLLADVHRKDGALASTTGELGMIGVRPDRQGGGLGRQLLRAGVRYLRGLGVTTVELAVNGRNEGALGLYESEGFVRVRTRDRWVRSVAMTRR